MDIKIVVNKLFFINFIIKFAKDNSMRLQIFTKLWQVLKFVKCSVMIAMSYKSTTCFFPTSSSLRKGRGHTTCTSTYM